MGGGNDVAKITLTCPVEFPKVPFNRRAEVLAMASLKAPVLEVNEEDKRAPIDIVCVIDRSGSMAGAKLNLTKTALSFVVEQLDERDTLGLVAYDTEVSTNLGMTKMDAEGKKKAKEIIGALHAGSMTNLSGGLLAGLTLAEQRGKPSDVCSVLLFTDGLANVGITSVPSITAATENKLAKCKEGTTVFTFGFGADHDADMLRSVASSGKGMYYFVETVDQIPLSFADCIGGLQSVVAQNIRLTIEALGGAKISKILSTGFKTTGDLPGTALTVALTDLYSEEQRDILFSFELPELPGPLAEAPFAQMTIDYFNILASNDERTSVGAVVSRPAEADVPAAQTRNELVDLQVNRITTVQALEAGRKLADQGKLDEAKILLSRAVDECKASPSAQTGYVQNLCEDISLALADMSTESSYQAMGRQKMFSKAQSHAVQRSNAPTFESAMYENKSKAKKKAFFS